MSYCSPKERDNGEICLDDESLDQLINFTESQKGVKIGKHLSKQDKIKNILNIFRNETSCSDKEFCLITSPTLKRTGIQRYFRPRVPKTWKNNKKTWLNTMDLLASLKQYEEGYSDFKLLSVSPIDFDTKIRNRLIGGETCVDRDLCSLDLNKLYKDGKLRFGAVFNLDKHNQSGSHWTSMFADLKLGEGYYFDSVANFLPNEITDLFQRISDQANTLYYKGILNCPKRNGLRRLEFNGKGDKAEISIHNLNQWLLRDNNIQKYRFGRILEYPKIIYPNKIDDQIGGNIIKKILDLVDKSGRDIYADTENLSNLLDKKDFAEAWSNDVYSGILKNLIGSIGVVSDGKNTWRVNSKELTGDRLILTLDRSIDSNKSLYDASFHTFKNYIQHQFKNTECGVYSINFIDTMLTTESDFFDIINKPLADDLVNKMRYTKYFTPV